MKFNLSIVVLLGAIGIQAILAQEISEIPCKDGSDDGEKCKEACEAKYAGTVGTCRNDLCFCSKDPLDLKCGGDGSFGGLKCPNVEACQLSCCRAGLSMGTCWFGLECRCFGQKI